MPLEPSALANPAAGRERLYAFQRMPRFAELVRRDANGRDRQIRHYVLGGREYSWRSMSAGTTLVQGNGITLGALGLITTPTLVAGDATLHQPFTQFQATALSTDLYAGPFSGSGSTGVGVWTPSNGAGIGGGYHCELFQCPGPILGSVSAFVGLGESVPGGTSNPLARGHHLGLSFQGTDAAGGNWYLSRRGPGTGPAGTRVELVAGTALGDLTGALVQNTLARGETRPIFVELFNPSNELVWVVGIWIVAGPANLIPVAVAMYDSNVPTTAIAGGVVSECYLRHNAAVATAQVMRTALIEGRSGAMGAA